jgi:hypothetical protein
VPKKRVFKEESCLDISIFLSLCLLCNNSQYFWKFNLCSDFGSSKQNVKTLNFAKNFEINYLDKLVKAYNMDRTENKRGTINAYVNLKFKLGDQKFNECFYVTGLGKQRIILGFPWLHRHNSIINWKKGEITFKPFQIDWRRLIEKGKRI